MWDQLDAIDNYRAKQQAQTQYEEVITEETY